MMLGQSKKDPVEKVVSEHSLDGAKDLPGKEGILSMPHQAFPTRAESTKPCIALYQPHFTGKETETWTLMT